MAARWHRDVIGHGVVVAGMSSGAWPSSSSSSGVTPSSLSSGVASSSSSSGAFASSSSSSGEANHRCRHRHCAGRQQQPGASKQSEESARRCFMVELSCFQVIPAGYSSFLLFRYNAIQESIPPNRFFGLLQRSRPSRMAARRPLSEATTVGVSSATVRL
jgi:hypothetical protein